MAGMKDSVLIWSNNFEKARNDIRKNKGKEIIFLSSNDELNRKVLEKLPIQILSINQTGRKDFQKQRNSGFNQVLARLAKKNNVAIGINLDEIINAKIPEEKSQILSRARQNVKLCNKHKVRMKFIAQKGRNYRDVYDLKSLGLVLGMPTWMIKNIT